VAYVYDPDGELPANLNAEMVELEALDSDESSTCTLRSRHTSMPPIPLWPAYSRRLGRTAIDISPGDAAGLQACSAGHRRAERDGVDIDKAIMAASHG